jgi:hypothetical protein
MEIVVPGQGYGRLQTIDIIASVRAVPPRGHDSCQNEIETQPVFLIQVIRAAVVLVQKVSCLAAPQARFEGNKDAKKIFLQERDRAQDARADARLDWPWPYIDHARRQLDPSAGVTKVSRRATR